MSVRFSWLDQNDTRIKNILLEIAIACRFGLIGIVATATHILVVGILILMTQLPILLVNTFAFFTAFIVSFVGHYIWTFQSPGDLPRAIRRFFLISACGFLFNTLVLAVVIRNRLLAPFYASVCSISVMPMVTYSASRLWGFRYSPQYLNHEIGEN